MRGESKKNFNNSINKKYDSRNNINNGLKYRNNFIKSTKNNNSLNKLNKIKNIKFKSNDLKDLLEEKDFEINALKYELAIKLDKRNYFHYYASLIKYNHPLMFSFGCYNDYNSRIIKIFLFFFSFGSDLTINALFFNDNTMHKIYKDKGKYDLLFRIPQILYSTFISKLIDTLIKSLSLHQNYIVELKQEIGKNNIKKKYTKILKIIKIKIILFFILSFVILSYFWYYIICFCGIYVNTQIHLIKDTIISLITSLIIPFFINLIPGIFRILALRMKKSSGKYLYKFSSFLENNLG